MKQKSYSEKLKDPRWQKVRLDVFARDDWSCQMCQNKEDTLHVHHKEYITGCDPWEYKLEVLLTLCSMCHFIISDKECSIGLPPDFHDARGFTHKMPERETYLLFLRHKATIRILECGHGDYCSILNISARRSNSTFTQLSEMLQEATKHIEP